MKRIINYDMRLDGGGGYSEKHYEGEEYYDSFTLNKKKWTQAPDGNWASVPAADYASCRSGNYGNNGNNGSYCAVGQSSSVYGYSSAVGQSYSVSGVPDVSYVNDLDVYYKHLYRVELKNKGLKGIGLNSLGLLPTVNRDDVELCKEIVYKFKTGKMTKFEKRLHEALQRKKEIEEKKSELLKRMNQNQESAKNKFDLQIEKLRNLPSSKRTGFESFIDQLKHSRYEGNQNPSEYLKQVKEEIVNPPKPIVKEKTDREYVKYLILVKLDSYNMYHYYNTIDGVDYVDFEFIPSINEDDTKLDLFVNLEVKVLDTEEKSASEKVRQVQEDDTVSNSVGNFLMKFTKKKTFIKKIRVEEEKLLKLAKEIYS
jgi:hypothetical protein